MQHSHYLLYKPDGYLSQFVNNGPKKNSKKLLGDLHDFATGTMAIGRLDEPSEGLLLLTTDGKMSEFVRSSKVEKEYYAQVDGLITPTAIQALQGGVDILINGSNYRTKACKVTLLDHLPQLAPRRRKIRDERHGPTSWIAITLSEGKFRQVRKMTAAVGFPTLRLVRVRVGNYTLDKLQPGEASMLPDFDFS